GLPPRRGPHQLESLVGAERRRARAVPTHGDDHALEELRRPIDEVDVPVRRRVEAAGVNRDVHAVAHRAAPPAGVAFEPAAGAPFAAPAVAGAVVGAPALAGGALAGAAAAGVAVRAPALSGAALVGAAAAGAGGAAAGFFSERGTAGAGAAGGLLGASLSAGAASGSSGSRGADCMASGGKSSSHSVRPPSTSVTRNVAKKPEPTSPSMS